MESMVEETGGGTTTTNNSLNRTSATGNGITVIPASAATPAANVEGNKTTITTTTATSAGGGGGGSHSVAAAMTPATANTVQFITTLSTAAAAQQPIQSVIQANQSSVIQSANNLQAQPLLGKVVVYGNKGSNSVIHTAPGLQLKHVKAEPNLHLQLTDTNSEDDSYSDEDAATKRRRDMLTRRPSYHKILKDISEPDLTGRGIQIASVEGGSGLHNLGSGSVQVQYSQGQDGQFFVPVLNSGPVMPEDQTRKREIRLQKNREAARECRRKKKEYIKCLENRVAVLENQNKALIEELKTLKELYCQTKVE